MVYYKIGMHTIMSVGNFEKNSLSWQLRQLQQQVGEWWEFQTDKINISPADDSFLSGLNIELILTILKILGWLLLVIIFCLLALQLVRLLSPYFYYLNNLSESTANTLTHKPLKNLSLSQWLEKAKKSQNEGNYREACRCLYMAALQRLNDNGTIPHQQSRTDGEYLQLIRDLSQPQPYQKIFQTHEQLLFGNLDASQSVFEECQQAYQQIDKDNEGAGHL